MSGEVFEVVRGSFMTEMLAVSVVIMIPMQKKPHFAARFLELSGVALAVSVFIPFHTYKYLIETALVGAIIYESCVVSWRKALYDAMCAYAIQHLSYCLTTMTNCIRDILLHTPDMSVEMNPPYDMQAILIRFLVYGTYCFFFVRKKKNPNYDVSVGQVISFSGFVIAVVLISSTFVQKYAAAGEYNLLLAGHVYEAVGCVFIICMDDGIYRSALAQNELSVIQDLWLHRQEQYVTARENINSINRKCHELKKQISEIQESGVSEKLSHSLDDLKDSIRIYDAVVKTGNETLDVVLTEKSLYCYASGITLACVVDGSNMEFMEITDIYFLFTNALDCAVKEAERAETRRKRQIAVTVWVQSGLLMIQIENYCAENIREKQDYATWQADDPKNKYAVKSMEFVVKRYNGCMTEHIEDELRIRRISIPVPDKPPAQGRKTL